MKCSALNVDVNGVRLDSLGSRSPPYERIKFAYPVENVRFLYSRLISSTRMVADRHRLGCRVSEQALVTSFPGVPTSMTLNDIEPKNMGFK